MQRGEINRETYSKYNNIFKEVIQEAKRRFNVDILKNSENLGKTMWSLVKKYRNNKTDHQELDYLLTVILFLYLFY